MAFYCTKPSVIQPSTTLYFTGDNRWSDQFSERVLVDSREEFDLKIANTDYHAGGFKTATVVEE